MPPRCPAVHDGERWTLTGHQLVVEAVRSAHVLASSVSQRRAIPNSLEGEEHAHYRALVDRFLSVDRVTRLEPVVRGIAFDLVESLPRGSVLDAVSAVGIPFAVRAQSAWLGWSRELEPVLVAWLARNRDARLSGDRHRVASAAAEFDALVQALIDERRRSPRTDVTSELLHATVRERLLNDAEVVSILRNWTAGDLSSLALSLGVIVHGLAARPEVQEALRASVAEGDAETVEAAVEELLRIDDPFVFSRRRAIADLELGGVGIQRGSTVRLNWAEANRDTAVFPEPDRYDPDRHASDNLVFGTGPHACPGRALTLMELRVVTVALIEATVTVEPAPGHRALRAKLPDGGWDTVPVVLERRTGS